MLLNNFRGFGPLEITDMKPHQIAEVVLEQLVAGTVFFVIGVLLGLVYLIGTGDIVLPRV